MDIRLLKDFDIVGNGKKIKADTIVRVTNLRGRELIEKKIAVSTFQLPNDVIIPEAKTKSATKKKRNK